ncbi:hypothetical protein A4G20_08945 [Pasteurellaceae bacterium RH1A]|nr:hypothetical protein A4G20_08945 [Pasteurellaceae bacterium RH1A]
MFSNKKMSYDDYLAEQIRLGREDIENGRVFTLEEAMQHWQQVLASKERELAQRELEDLAYA